MKTLREELTCSRSPRLEGDQSQTRCLNPRPVSSLAVAAGPDGCTETSGLQTRAPVPLIRFSGGSGSLPSSVLLGQSLPSLSCSFRSNQGLSDLVLGRRGATPGGRDVPPALW